MKCPHCGMTHSPSLDELLGNGVVPVTRAELRNQLAKDSLEYTVRHWAGGKAICLFDVRLGRLWQAAANGWRQGRQPLLGGLLKRLAELGVSTPNKETNTQKGGE